MGTWNVRTMCPGLDEDLQKVTNARKTAIIDRELSRLNLDIVALQETRLSSFGSLKEKNYTFFWQGLEPEERRIHGVGFAIKNTLLSSVEPPPRVRREFSLFVSSLQLGMLPSSASTPLHSLQAQKQRTHFTNSWMKSSRPSPPRKNCTSLETSMHAPGQIKTHGHAASDTLELASKTKTANASLNYVHSMISASPTPSLPPSPSTKPPGGTQDPTTGINLI